MKTSHSPGPWKVNYRKFSQVQTSSGQLVATCEKQDSLTRLQANARLIAMSPELFDLAVSLSQLEDGLRNGNSASEDKACWLATTACALIAKATGNTGSAS